MKEKKKEWNNARESERERDRVSEKRERGRAPM